MLFLSHWPAKPVVFPPVTLLVIYHPTSRKAAQSQLLSHPVWATAIHAAGESLSGSLSKKKCLSCVF